MEKIITRKQFYFTIILLVACIILTIAQRIVSKNRAEKQQSELQVLSKASSISE